MSLVNELEDKLAALKEKASGELEDVAGKLEDVFHKLLDDDGVADKVTEKVAADLHVVADKLSAVADKVSAAFEKDPSPATPAAPVDPTGTVQ